MRGYACGGPPYHDIVTMLRWPLVRICREVIPFLIIAIGVENIFYITNAVVCTSIDLPVRLRIAEGTFQPPLLCSSAASAVSASPLWCFSVG